MPQLSDIVGQEEAIDRLQRLLASGRMPHALLFAGPDGVGRRTTAIALAKTLLCENPKQMPPAQVRPGERAGAFPEACNQCASCRMVEAGTHGDLNMIYKELAAYHEDTSVRGRVMQELSIEVIRSFLIAPAGRSSSAGRGKVFIVLEAELMSNAAQNALLKTLEEPPPGVTIILVSEQPEQLLPTTLSRCSMVRFGLLPRQFVMDKLAQAGVASQEAEFWAAFTGGSVGRALTLARQDMYGIKRKVVQRIADLPPAGDAELGEELASIADSLATTAVKESRGDGELSKMLAIRRASGSVLELIASAFQDAMTVAAGAGRPIIHADQRAEIERLARRLELTQLARVIEQLSHYEQLLWRNVNPRVIWDNVVITCASAAPLELHET